MPAKFKKNRQSEKNHKRANNADGSFRVIAGKHRSRRLSFPSVEGLRPTTDRVKETVFNWLSHEVPGAQVLDLFAGSGALGFEALSRDADRVVFVELDKQAQAYLKQNVALLNETAEVLAGDALSFLNGHQGKAFDLIFIDPPFRKELAQQVIDTIVSTRACAERGLIYLETEQELNSLNIPNHWSELKSKTAGQVSYRLFRNQAESE